MAHLSSFGRTQTSSRMAALLFWRSTTVGTRQPGILPRHKKFLQRSVFSRFIAERCCSMFVLKPCKCFSNMQFPRIRMARPDVNVVKYQEYIPSQRQRRKDLRLITPSRVPHQLFLTFYHFHYQACPVVLIVFIQT